MTSVPPLPDPGVQSPADRVAISRRFIHHAREELAAGNRLQAGEKAWGAVAQHLKLFAEQRGWNNDSHRHLESIGSHIVVEYNQPELGIVLSEAYHKGHRNFYENQWSMETLGEMLELVEEGLPLLEALQGEAPRHFTITSNRQRRRLTELTGDGTLQVGDMSPVGFSLRHAPGSDNGSGQGAGAGG